MKISLKHIGSYAGNPSKIIELIIEDWSTTITQEITDLNSIVDEELIYNLRQVADELEEHNTKVKEKS